MSSEVNQPIVDSDRAESHSDGSSPNSVNLLVEFLYLDADVCSRCRGTEAVLDDALAVVSPAVAAAGVDLEVRKTHVDTEDVARSVGLVSSPTIRINGEDIQPDVEESDCTSCGSLSGGSVDCRVWTYEGEEYTTPPKALLVNAILSAMFTERPRVAETDQRDLDGRGIPENLERFFADRRDETVDRKLTGATTEDGCGCNCR